MSEILNWVQTYGNTVLTAAFGVVMLTVFISQFRLLHRVRKMQKRIDRIADAVSDYLSVVMEPDGQEQTPQETRNYVLESKMQKDEEETRIISSVLQEIFP